VAEHEARPLRISMPAHANDRAIVHGEVKHAIRPRDFAEVRGRSLLFAHVAIFSEHAHRVDIDTQMNLAFAGAPGKRRLHRGQRRA